MVGGREKYEPLVPDPAGFVTVTNPVTAPLGTVAEIWLEETTLKTADCPPKVTDEAPVKSLPEMVTTVPVEP